MQAWGYRKWVRDWLEANRIAPLQGLERPTVGFHIRGGDVFEVDNELVRANTASAGGLGSCEPAGCGLCVQHWSTHAESGMHPQPMPVRHASARTQQR